MSLVVTVTLSPALDVSTATDSIAPGRKLRCDTAIGEPGGGGVNVARVAHRLGTSTKAVVVVAGTTGTRLVELCEREGLQMIPVEVDGETRQSFNVVERSSGSQYRFVLPSQPITASAIGSVAEVLRAEGSMSCLAISGSTPPNMPTGALTSLIEGAPSGVPVIVDTSGPALAEALATSEAILKPSANELSVLAGRELTTEADVLVAARDLLADAACSAILVSIGPGGAFLARRSEPPVRFRAPTVNVKSAVGAGDSMVGGLAVALCRGHDLIEAATHGVAAGTAAVLSAGTSLCARADVERLLPLVVVEQT